MKVGLSHHVCYEQNKYEKLLVSNNVVASNWSMPVQKIPSMPSQSEVP